MTTSLKKNLVIACLCLCLAPAVYGQNVAAELNITLGEQRVRFAPTRSFQEMRLEVINSVGEVVFTQLVTEAEFDWNLRAGNGEALTPGLYRYALTLKFSEELTRQHTGHFIVEKSQDQIWLTANEGATVSSSALNASRSGGRSITGFGKPDEGKRDASARELASEKDQPAATDKAAVKREKAALLGTLNKVAKFDAGGVNVIDSTITEVGGFVGVNTVAPTGALEVYTTALNPVQVQMDGPVNTALTMQLDNYGVTGGTSSGSGFLGRFANGTKAAPANVTSGSRLGFNVFGGWAGGAFRHVAAINAHVGTGTISATSLPSYLNFMTTPSGSVSRLERMRIDQNGNVGIGTTAPTAQLHVFDASPPIATGVIYGATSSQAAVARAVVGEVTATAPGNSSAGVRGINRGTGSMGAGVSGSHDGTGIGVFGLAISGGSGVYGIESIGGAGFAGYFAGDVHVEGTLTKGGGAFKIDHPLDPENKYLSHSFVESPDMKNIYDGVATLDQYGVAEITLPDWFSALNDKFRYQLTAIDAPGPNLFIAQKIANHRFKIAGGMPGLEVSWQVTGIRKDAFAEKYRIPVEELKPEKERGAYLHPEAFNQPEEKGVEWARHPEMMKQMKDEREKAKQPAPPKPDSGKPAQQTERENQER